MNYIASPMVESFFLVVPPGLEGFASAELRQKLALLSELKGKPIEFKVSQKSKGGILLECERSVGFALNHWLRIPTRILLRIDEFRCKDFPKLFNRLRKLPWHNFLRQGEIEYSVSVHESRLKIKEKIAETVRDAIRNSQQHQPLRKTFLETPQIVFIRIKQDEVFVSVDTSGEALFRRGHKPFSVDAPIRETLAAALIWPMISKDPQGTAVDMMAGSGTLGFEAMSFYQPIRTRKFAYQNFPELSEADKFVGKSPLKKTDLKLTSYEVDKKAFEALNKNVETFGKAFDVPVETFKQDVFESENSECHLMCNPPYDERLAVESKSLAKNLQDFYSKTKPRSICLVWPGENPPKLDFEWTNSLVTSNGGIPVTLNFWARDNSESRLREERKLSERESSEAK